MTAMHRTEMKYISKNLFSFYREAGRLGEGKMGKIAGVDFVDSPENGWPGYLLGGKFLSDKQVLEIKTAMAEEKVPALWIQESAPGDEIERRLSNHGIRMINYWTGMFLDKAEVSFALDPGHEYVIQKLDREADLDLWTELVNGVIMTSTHLDPRLIRKLSYSEKFHFYGLWDGDELLSTTLIFVDKQTAGLYFVATKETQQGKGYGTAITGVALNDMKAQGIQRFVLHATRQGSGLYRKLGFREVNRYGIFWLLRKR